MKNHMKLDPTRTFLLRRKAVADMRKKFQKIISAVYQLIVTDDAFGLKKSEMKNSLGLLGQQSKIIQKRAEQIINANHFQFLTNDRKVSEFKKWLKIQVDSNILQVSGGLVDRPWTAEYIDSAYKKGMMGAYTAVHHEDLSKSPDWYLGTKEGFLRQAFAQPESTAKVRLLYTRSYSDLKGITDQMDVQMSRILANGLVNGEGPLAIARQMSNSIEGLSKTRAQVLARTEIINAHAEGQLDAFEQLGVEKVNAEVEWLTAGDGLVCDECDEMGGKVFSVEEAHGMLPLHPNCRCAWMPVVE